MDRSDAVLAVLGDAGTVLEGHFVLKSRRHSGRYVNKDLLYTRPFELSRIARFMADQAREALTDIEVVVGPAVGAIGLNVLVGYYLGTRLGTSVRAAYAEKADDDSFELRRGFVDIVRGRRTLVVEDILTTGGSAKGTVTAVEKVGGIVIGLTSIVDRRGLTAADLNVPVYLPLLRLTVEDYPESPCPLCAAGVPVNEEVGHGREFMEAKRRAT